jgi:hypothetical protein
MSMGNFIAVKDAAVVLLGGCLLASCAGSPIPAASGELQCPEEQLAKKSIGGYLEKVSGCGKDNVYAFMGKEGWVSPLEKASFDLSCDKKDLKPVYLGQGSVGVSGCGKKVRYEIVRGVGWVADVGSSNDDKPDRRRKSMDPQPDKTATGTEK